MSRPETFPLVLAFHPASRGVGWVLLQGPSAPVDWGITFLRSDSHRGVRRSVETLVERYRPEVLVVERFHPAVRSVLGPALRDAVAALASRLELEVAQYSRAQVRAALALSPTAGRQATAERVADHFAVFRHRLPPPRRPWEGADRRLALFSAGALALTHYANGDAAPPLRRSAA